ncbi:hypothetical protein OROGR_018104 [Orobanche gracilis]
MPKRSLNRKQLKHSPECPVVEHERPKKKVGSEIDEIFAGKKRKRPEKDKANNQKKPVKGPQDGLRIVKNVKSQSLKDSVVKDNGILGSTSRPRKNTADGLTIYTEEELGIGKADAGGTGLCPFDCNCCF